MAKSPDARTGNQNDDSGKCGRLDTSLSRPTNDQIMMMEKEKKKEKKNPSDYEWRLPPSGIVLGGGW